MFRVILINMAGHVSFSGACCVNSASSVREKVSQASMMPLSVSAKMCIVSMTSLRVWVLVLCVSSSEILPIFLACGTVLCVSSSKILPIILACRTILSVLVCAKETLLETYIFFHAVVEGFHKGTVLYRYLLYSSINLQEEVFAWVNLGYSQ
jgi:hypothetical protein